MIDRGKRSVLGVNINVIDYDGAVSRIIHAAQASEPLAVSALAVHGVMTGALDPEHKFRLNSFALLTPDGQPVRWALGFLHGEHLPDRVYGPNLMLEVCQRCEREGLSIYLYGSRPEVLELLAANLSRAMPALRIAGTEPSKFRRLSAFEAHEVDARITASSADVVFVGLGCPRQEVFAFEHTNSLSRPVLAVGAAFDFHSGQLAQAPRWMQDRGLEWLYRLSKEPLRLWRRYLLLNPAYVTMMFAQRLGILSDLMQRERRPVGRIGYG